MVTEETDLYWLAGLLEGEGCFQTPIPSAPRQVRIVLNMCDRDVVQKAAELMGGNKICKIDKSDRKGWRDLWSLSVGGSTASSIMRMIYPLMGERRKEQIDAALSSIPAEHPRPCRICGAVIPYIEGSHFGQKVYCTDACRVEGRRQMQRTYDKKRYPRSNKIGYDKKKDRTTT